MTRPAQSGARVLTSLFGLRVATDTLSVKGLSEAYLRFLCVAMRTSDIGIPLLEFALIQDVLTVLVPVMTVGTREVPSHVSLMGESNGRSLFLVIRFHIVDNNLLRLGAEHRQGHRRRENPEEQYRAYSFHSFLPFPGGAF